MSSSFSSSPTNTSSCMATIACKPQRRKILLLTGAPKRQDLSWTDDALTVESSKGAKHTSDALPEDSQDVVRWRKLPLHQGYLHTGLTQPHWPEYLSGPHPVDEDRQLPEDTSLSLVSNTATNEEQVVDDALNIARPSFTSGNTSMSTNASVLDTSWSILQHEASILDNFKVTSLADLSSVVTLEKASRPHSIVFNLLVIVLAISTQRMQVATDNGKIPVDLVRLIVADETKSAFEISIWLNCTESNVDGNIQHDVALRAVVDKIARLDILLVRNVGLRTFKGKVHASSLKRMTQIHQLPRSNYEHRRNIQENCASSLAETAGPRDIERHVAQKMRRIIDWRDRHQDVLAAGWRNLEEHLRTGCKRRRLTLTETLQFPVDTQ